MDQPMPSSVFPRRFWRDLLVLFAVLALATVVADLPRALSGLYLGDLTSDKSYAYTETYRRAGEIAASSGEAIEFGAWGRSDPFGGREDMNETFAYVLLDHFNPGFALRIATLLLLLVGAVRIASRSGEEKATAARLRVAGTLAAAGSGYTLLLSLATPVSGAYYFAFTLAVLIGTLGVDDVQSGGRVKPWIAISLAAALFYALIDPAYISMRGASYYDYMVRARISLPVYYILGILQWSLMFILPYRFFLRWVSADESPVLGTESPARAVEMAV